MRTPLLLLLIGALGCAGSLALASETAHVAVARNLKVKKGHPILFAEILGQNRPHQR